MIIENKNGLGDVPRSAMKKMIRKIRMGSVKIHKRHPTTDLRKFKFALFAMLPKVYSLNSSSIFN